MRARRTAFVFFVCAIIVAYVKFYNLLKKDTQALNIQQIAESKTRSPRTKYSDASSKETQDEVMTKGNKNDVIRRDSRDDIINDLEKQISKLRDQLNELNKQCDMPTNTVEGVSDKTTTEIKSEKSAKHSLNRQTKAGHGATVTANKPRKVIPSNRMNEQTNFNLFTIENIFFVNPGEKPRTYFTNQNLAGEYEHLNDAVDETMAALKKHLNLNSSLNLTLKTGVYRNDVNFGVEYDIQVMYEGDKSTYNVRLVRPLSPLILLHPPVKVNLDKLVNIIVPLQGRLESFREFLDNFKKVCVLRKENVFLTVVYSGTKGERDVRKMLNTLTKEYDFRKFELVTRKQNFNRGHALDEAVRNWKGQEDVLLFFCDVDIAFNSDFIDRCRIYSEPGRKVYYPMVFSLYNPKYVQETTTNFWKISKETGFWRNYGYGMTCQHRQDYRRVGGFDLKITGWGSEDVELHRKYVSQKNIRIIRAPDGGLVHRYHTKDCDSRLPRKRYRNCISVKVSTEASKAQYGRRVLELEESFKKTGYKNAAELG